MRKYFLTWTFSGETRAVGIFGRREDYALADVASTYNGQPIIDRINFFDTPEEALEQVEIWELRIAGGTYGTDWVEI